MIDLEHPQISEALRTGYGRKVDYLLFCDRCGEELGDIYYRFGDECLCEECLVKTAIEILRDEPSLAAEFLNAKMEVA